MPSRGNTKWEAMGDALAKLEQDIVHKDLLDFESETIHGE